MKKLSILFFIVFFIGINIVYAASAKKDADATKKDTVAADKADAPAVGTVLAVKPDKVQGQISAIGKDYITVSYSHDTAKGIEYEMMLPIEKDMQFKNRKSLEEFHVGDTVEVAFDDLTEVTADGEKARHKTKALTFISPAAPEPSALVSPQ